VKCPKCDGELQPVKYEGLEVDRCAQCGGLWFDNMETDRLLKSKGSAKSIDTGDVKTGEKQNAIGSIDCPRCHTPMIRMVDIKQHHIWYESCGVCHGKWFDAGEFKDLQEKSILDYFRDMFTSERE
jgi:Zn-finger nucleic acid-binding protein